MPVLRDYRMADGTKKTIVDPDYEHRYREFMLHASPQLDWQDDPSYYGFKKRRPK